MLRLILIILALASITGYAQTTTNCLNNPGTPNPWPNPTAANGGYISLGSLGAESKFSISMWVKPASSPNGHSILLDCSHGGSNNWVVQSLDYGESWGFLGVTFDLEFDTWQHLLCTYDNGLARVYVGGTLVGENAWTITWGGTTSVYLGNWPEGGRRFKGQVDEVLVTRNILYGAQFVPRERVDDNDIPSNSLGLWHFDEGSGNVTKNEVSGATTNINNWTWTTRSIDGDDPATETLPSYASSDGLVAWWGFNGHANDVSTNNNDLRGVGGASLTADRRGNSNSAFFLDGNDDYLRAAGSASINAIETADKFSLSIWFKNENANENAVFSLIDKYRESTDLGWEVLVAKNFIEFIVGTTNTIGHVPGNDCTPTIAVNQWVHLVFTYNKAATKGKLYIGGAEVCDRTINLDITTTDNGPFYIGYSPNGPDEISKGRFDDVGLWDRVLTAAEVTQLYESLTITTHPSGSSVAGGQQATMTVAAAVSGSASLSYQWQRNDGSGYANITDGADYSGATGATLTIKSAKVSKKGPYRCVVTTANSTANSNGASLTVTCPCNQ
jgi:hypothetical protein